MMKFVFTLVGLLHLCYSAKSNIDLTTEMIRRLEELNKLYNDNKVNITSPGTVHVPTNHMNANALSCEDVFCRELHHLLNNTMIHEDSKNILKELKANLKELERQKKKAKSGRCPMTLTKGMKPFGTYARFLRKLNSSMKRL